MQTKFCWSFGLAFRPNMAACTQPFRARRCRYHRGRLKFTQRAEARCIMQLHFCQRELEHLSNSTVVQKTCLAMRSVAVLKFRGPCAWSSSLPISRVVGVAGGRSIMMVLSRQVPAQRTFFSRPCCLLIWFAVALPLVGSMTCKRSGRARMDILSKRS